MMRREDVGLIDMTTVGLGDCSYKAKISFSTKEFIVLCGVEFVDDAVNLGLKRTFSKHVAINLKRVSLS